ncbi:hypothetical protein RUND412_011560 [Rhizina undulata]
MDIIPNEILQEIFSYLLSFDLDKVRLVNHMFCTTANIFKFRALHVCISREGLDDLLNISRKPELAQCVREITYPFCRLPLAKLAYFDEEEFEEGDFDEEDGAGRDVTSTQGGYIGL